MIEWLTGNSAAEWARGEWTLTALWPLWLYFTLLFGGLLLLSAVLWWRARGVAWWRLGVLLALQGAMLALALLLLWQPALRLQTLRAGENTVAVVLDTSGSMALTDPTESRQQQARQAFDSESMQALAADYKLRRFQFDRNARAVESFDSQPAHAGQSNVGASVLQVLRTLQTTPLGALVLISDGADSGGALDAGQLQEIAAFGVPVHAVGIGRERMPEDLELQEVQLPDKTLPGTALSARVTLRHDGAGVAQIKAYDGDRFIASREVALGADSTLTSTFLNFELPDAGYRDIRISVDAKEGERTLVNNLRRKVVQVAGRRASILYVEGEPRWELKFMRRALEKDSGVRLLSLLRTSPNGYYRQGVDRPDELQDGFPNTRAQLFQYDALVIGSVPAAWFKGEQLQLLREFVSDRGGALMMLAGPEGLGDGGWGSSTVGRILPAQLPSGAASFQRVQVQAVLTARGRRAAQLRLSDATQENDSLWAGLPAVADFQHLGALRPAAVALLNVKVGEREQPLLVTQPYGRGRTSIFATGGSWRWQMLLPLEDQRHETFWRQMARWLVADAPERLSLSAQSRGDEILLRAEVRNDEFAPLSGASVQALANAGGQPIAVTLAPTGDSPGVYEGVARADQSGMYFIDATIKQGARSLGKASTVLEHEQGSGEQHSLRQNRALLEQLARATGGNYWSATELEGLPEAVRASAAGVRQTELRPLWGVPLVFVLLLALKAGEWLLRRRWGMI